MTRTTLLFPVLSEESPAPGAVGGPPTDEATTAAAPAERQVPFMGHAFVVSGGVLAPRRETELLGRVAVDLAADLAAAPVIIDMCCGCGNLAVALALRLPQATVYACDLTPETTRIAWRNVQRFRLEDRLTVVESDMFAALRPLGLEGRVDMVVCNPPYISTGRLAGDRAYLLESEPREAFDGGPYGLTIHQRLIREAADFLRPGGRLAFEFGEGQERQIAALITRSKAYGSAQLVLDGFGRPRVGFAERVSSTAH